MGGYSSVAVVGDRIYTTGMPEEAKGVLSVLDTDGKLVKQAPYGEETLNKNGPGARSTPTVDGDRLYLLSGVGGLNCFKLPDLEVLWQVDIPRPLRRQEDGLGIR